MVDVYIAVAFVLTVVWLSILTYILTTRVYISAGLKRMASQWASYMQGESTEAKRTTRDTKLIASGQAKLMDNIAGTIPGAAAILKSSGLSDQEGWAMITDPATMKGVKVIVDALGGVAKFIDKTGEKKPRRKGRKTAGAPLIEYKPV